MSHTLHELYQSSLTPEQEEKSNNKSNEQRKKGTSDSFDLDKIYLLGCKLFKSEEHTQKTLGLVMCIGVTMGLRIQDILQLKTDYIKPQLDSTDYRLVLKETKWKTDFDKMIPEGVMEMLGQYLQYNKIHPSMKDEFFFLNPKTGKFYSTHWVNKRFRILQSQYKWLREGDKTFSSHSLRKSYAMTIYKYYGNDLMKVKQALNHSSVKITERYLHTSKSEKQDIHVRNSCLGHSCPNSSASLCPCARTTTNIKNGSSTYRQRSSTNVFAKIEPYCSNRAKNGFGHFY